MTKQKRNVGMHTSADESKKNILEFLLRTAPNHEYRGAIKSTLGYVAYPNYDFKCGQGAAFAVAKIVRDMENDGLVWAHRNGLRGYGYYLTAKGHAALALAIKGGVQ